MFLAQLVLLLSTGWCFTLVPHTTPQELCPVRAGPIQSGFVVPGADGATGWDCWAMVSDTSLPFSGALECADLSTSGMFQDYGEIVGGCFGGYAGNNWLIDVLYDPPPGQVLFIQFEPRFN